MVSKAKRRLARAAQPGDDRKAVAGNFHVDVLEVVLARAMHGDPVQHNVRVIVRRWLFIVDAACAGSANCVITIPGCVSASNAGEIAARPPHVPGTFQLPGDLRVQGVRRGRIRAARAISFTSAQRPLPAVRHVPDRTAEGARPHRPDAYRLSEHAGTHGRQRPPVSLPLLPVQFFDRRAACDRR